MIEKYTNGAMVEVGYDRYETSTDTFTTLPTELIADSVSAYTIKGNMEQNGTPTPSNPITPTECGVRTEQLLDKDNIVDGGPFYPTAATAKMVASNNTKILLIPCEPNTTYTVSRTNAITKRFLIGFLTSADIYVDMPVFGVAGSNNALIVSSTSDVDSRYLCLYYAKSGGSDSSTSEEIQAQLAEIMINKGPTAKPYEPYGFKIGILYGQTTNVNLGETQTVRAIKKLVLDGTETSWKTGGGFYYNDSITPDYLRTANRIIYCTHYQGINSVTGGGSVGDGECSFYSAAGVQRLYIHDDNYTSLDAFKAYLAQQYAAGTPVTVWYVLATAQTGIVNEPLRKIGDYADSITGLSIPTTGTAEQFDVDTPIKPSEVSLTYTGWHNKSDHKF